MNFVNRKSIDVYLNNINDIPSYGLKRPPYYRISKTFLVEFNIIIEQFLSEKLEIYNTEEKLLQYLRNKKLAPIRAFKSCITDAIDPPKYWKICNISHFPEIFEKLVTLLYSFRKKILDN